jgi:hypothetical protein
MTNQIKSLETQKPWLIKVGKKTFIIRNMKDIERVLEYGINWRRERKIER